MRRPSRLDSLHSTDLPSPRGAKGHSAGFQGQENLIPLCKSENDVLTGLLDFLKGDPPLLRFPNVEAEFAWVVTSGCMGEADAGAAAFSGPCRG